MRTLLLSEIFPPRTGGSGRWFWEIYRRLDPSRYLVAAGQSLGQDAFDSRQPLQILRLPLAMPEWGILSWSGSRDYWKHIRRLRQLVQLHEITKIHCGRCLPEGVMCLALKKWLGVPFVCYVHGEDISTVTNSREHAFMVRRVLSSADYCIANSQNTARMLCDQWHVPAGQVRVLHPGVDTNQFHPTNRSETVRRKLGWNERPVVLTVGRLQLRKGQDMLIRAIPIIRSTLPNVLYAIVGAGEEREFLEGLARELNVMDHVQFRGEPNDQELVECYQQCDVFALPNREIDGDIEGFGMVLLEAQACGRPVIAGQSGGTAETLAPGSTGFVVDCRQPEPIAKLLTELLTAPKRCEHLGRAARNRMVTQFDWNALAMQSRRLFELGRKQDAMEEDEPISIG